MSIVTHMLVGFARQQFPDATVLPLPAGRATYEASLIFGDAETMRDVVAHLRSTGTAYRELTAEVLA